MISSKPLQSLSLLRNEDEAPIAASFAGTLRAFGKAQQLETTRARPPLVAPATRIKPKKAPDSLIKGLYRKPNRKSRPADVAATGEQVSEDKKRSQIRNAPLLARVWAWLQKQRTLSTKKQLRVSDTVSLGEKRFIALVHVEGQKFLIGGGASGVSLLAELNNDAEIESSLALEAEEDSQVLQPIALAGGRSR